MIFTELRFLFFFLAVLAVYWNLRSNDHRKIWLLLCSFAFYSAWNWRFLLLILGTTHVDYFVGMLLARTESVKRRKILLVLSLAANLGVLAAFKYFNFFASSAEQLSNLLGFPLHARTLNVILPVGLSFHTFQGMSYTIDIYRRKLKPTSSLLDFALYIVFFPQIVAGPIVRAADFIPELARNKTLESVEMRRCMVMFLIGFFKKACISDNIAPFIDTYFLHPERFSVGSSWLAALLYSVQIYCDFSGYTDIAIASAGMLGYPMVKNFDFPYFSQNIMVFWHRWHISLSTWFRDYLYIPLGGSRCSEWMIARNLMITMALAGLWHGAAWNFILWGLVEGLALVVYRAVFVPLNTLRPLRDLPPAFGILATFLYSVCISTVFFRSTGMGNILITLRALVFFQSPGTGTIPHQFAYVLVLLIAIHFISYRGYLRGWYDRLPSGLFHLIYGFAFAWALALARTDYAPFVYFQF